MTLYQIYRLGQGSEEIQKEFIKKSYKPTPEELEADKIKSAEILELNQRIQAGYKT